MSNFLHPSQGMLTRKLLNIITTLNVDLFFKWEPSLPKGQSCGWSHVVFITWNALELVVLLSGCCLMWHKKDCHDRKHCQCSGTVVKMPLQFLPHICGMERGTRKIELQKCNRIQGSMQLSLMQPDFQISCTHFYTIVITVSCIHRADSQICNSV